MHFHGCWYILHWNSICFTHKSIRLVHLPTHTSRYVTVIGLISEHVDPSKLVYVMNLAPVTFIKHTDSLLLKAAADFHLAGLIDDLGFGEFLPSNGLLEHLLPAFCAPLSGLCDNVLELLCGPSHFINQTRIDVYLSYTPAGTSCLDLDHWSQGIRSDSFQAYDWVRFMSCLSLSSVYT